MVATQLEFPMLELENVEYLEGRQLHFDSIAEMFTVRAQERPEDVHVYYYDQVIKYGQTNQRANQVANFLKEKGVGKGDVVSIMILNSPENYYTMLGAQKLGAVAGVVNFMLKGPEIAYVLDDSKPKVAFVGSEYMKDFEAGYQQASHKPIVVEVFTGLEHGSSIAACTLSEILQKYSDQEALVAQNPDDPFLLLYSSGTTGSPKGVMLANKAELSMCRAMSKIQLFHGGDVVMLMLPFFHVNPICVWSYPIMYAGQTACIRKAFSPIEVWPSITNYGITVLMGVPAMYAYIFSSVDPATIDRGKLKLRYAFCGAAPLPVNLITGFKEKYNVEIVEGYGLTESCGVSTVNPPKGIKKYGATGMAMPEQEVAIMDDSNRIMAVSERGEVCIKGLTNMIGYLNKAEATAETMIDGWLHTGDIGYMDEDGYIYIVDRKKDMINRGGENIYPREVEIAIEQHPAVAEVAVIGIFDEALGERVKAFVVPKPDCGQLCGADIQNFCAERIAKYKIPEFVDVTTTIPRNPTGKILKQELRKMEATKRA